MSMNANAVWISKAEKSYVKFNGKPLKVFQEVNMTVPYGSIYGLLGPSGCGKTSILRCIVGRQKFDKGQLLVLGRPPGSKGSKVPGSNVGYMPQETSLIDTMSVRENIWYYGAIVGLSDEEIKTRMAYYINILRLPQKKTLISNLSGGQARRVSLTIALLHKPKLIILDEPTVGIDPIVKASIWRHLIDLVHAHKTSIIITTHYIEEACNAQVVGMMHAGTIVAEDYTDKLMSRYDCDKLEDVFLKLSYIQNNRILNAVDSGKKSVDIPKIIITESSSSPTLSTILPMEERYLNEGRANRVSGDKFRQKRSFISEFLSECHIRKRPLQSIVMKNMLFLLRFPGALLCLIFLPCVTLGLFHYTYEGPIQPLRIKVVNDDYGIMGKQFVALIDPNVLTLSSYGSLLEANKTMDDAYGIIHLNRNFSDNLQERYINGIFQSKEVLKAKDIQLYMHNTYYHIKIRMLYQILNAYQKFMTIATDSSIAQLPIVFNRNFYNFLENPTFRAATFNTVTIIMHFCALGGTVLLLFVELKKGYIERNFVAGTTSAELFFGLMIVQSFIVFIQSLSNAILFIIFYHEDIKGSWILIFFLFLCVALTGSLFGLMLSVAIDQIYQITLIGVLCCISSGCTTAAYYPIESMPYFFQYFCKATPLFFPLQALKAIVHYGWGLTHVTVLAGFLISFFWMGIFMLLFIILFNLLRARDMGFMQIIT